MLPEWLNESSNRPQESQKLPGRMIRGHSFWRRTLDTLADTLKKEVIAEESANRPGLLQRIDPRIKLLLTAAIVVGLSFIRDARWLAASIVLCMAAAVCSKIRITTFLKSITPVVVLTSVLALPSATAFITPGPKMVALGPLIVTYSGLHVAVRFFLGAVACVSVVSLLVLSTPRIRLLASVRSLGVPHIFVMTLLMTYRYLFVLLRDAEEMHLAKESRTIHQGRPGAERQWVAARAGDLFMRSKRLADRVYLAMAARGFGGEARSLDDMKWNRKNNG